MINVLFFGPVAERVGVSRVEVDFVPGMCVADVRAQLELCYPEAFALVSLVAVDGEHVRAPAARLADRCELVFMSKFSGG